MTGRPFAVFDIDGTLIRWQLYHAIADALVKLGHIDSSEYGSIRDARMTWKRRSNPNSFKEYQKELVKVYEKVLLKISYSQFEEAVETVFEEYKDQVYTYTRDLIERLKKDGYLLFAISGSQTEIIEKIADYYGFDDFVGTSYYHQNNKFTGAYQAGFEDKDKVLKKMIAKHQAKMEDSLAVGDSTGDIKMLEVVERPIVFNPEQALFDHARKKDWKVIVERKNMVYELEGENGKYVLAETSAR